MDHRVAAITNALISGSMNHFALTIPVGQGYFSDINEQLLGAGLKVTTIDLGSIDVRNADMHDIANLMTDIDVGSHLGVVIIRDFDKLSPEMCGRLIGMFAGDWDTETGKTKRRIVFLTHKHDYDLTHLGSHFLNRVRNIEVA